MELTVAEPADFIQIARDVYDLWSAGLTKDSHRHLLWSNFYHPWSRRNYYRLVCKHKEQVIVSCKVVHLSLMLRGKEYKVLGLGAIYTLPAHRGKGLATSLVKSMINEAVQKSIDGLLLFSDIDRQFYAACGFLNLGNLDFEIDNNFYSLSANSSSEENLSWLDVDNIPDEQETKFRFSSFSPWLESDEIDEILRCYNHWLSKQPYGILRTHNYFTFQLARHLFIATYSKNNKPKLCLTLLKNKQTIAGYAISERGQNCLRILEVIGTDAARAELWHNLVGQAQHMGLKRSSGFESVSRDFVPYKRLEEDRLALKPPIKPSHINCYERTWGQPMFLSLNSVLDKLPEYNPCPLLEFDYI